MSEVADVDPFAVDGQISSFLLKLLELSASMLVRLVLVMVVAPIFTAAVLFFGAISGFCARAYMKAQLPVKREQSKTRAPLIGHLNSTVASLGASEAAFELLTVGSSFSRSLSPCIWCPGGFPRRHVYSNRSLDSGFQHVLQPESVCGLDFAYALACL